MSNKDPEPRDSVGIQFTSVKLKGPNYLLWAKAMRIGTKGKLNIS